MSELRPTNDLRWRDGVLQQRWEEKWITSDGMLLKDIGEPVHSEWRDVPDDCQHKHTRPHYDGILCLHCDKFIAKARI